MQNFILHGSTGLVARSNKNEKSCFRNSDAIGKRSFRKKRQMHCAVLIAPAIVFWIRKDLQNVSFVTCDEYDHWATWIPELPCSVREREITSCASRWAVSITADRPVESGTIFLAFPTICFFGDISNELSAFIPKKVQYSGRAPLRAEKVLIILLVC
ncbi:LAME_0A04412g1_1 [Lachancea meyersii CBS 8951]|uniref:LAME_0A04412g1_1 n=1 Tax=Lachancea meyersii CBS 8951 TaxID=1266667 RepID=A0A1G4INY4_9SACH|nr:LAME_0A04412g1_1 [Lachancea meyersii CBS 8951]